MLCRTPAAPGRRGCGRGGRQTNGGDFVPARATCQDATVCDVEGGLQRLTRLTSVLVDPE